MGEKASDTFVAKLNKRSLARSTKLAECPNRDNVPITAFNGRRTGLKRKSFIYLLCYGNFQRAPDARQMYVTLLAVNMYLCKIQKVAAKLRLIISSYARYCTFIQCILSIRTA